APATRASTTPPTNISRSPSICARSTCLRRRWHRCSMRSICKSEHHLTPFMRRTVAGRDHLDAVQSLFGAGDRRRTVEDGRDEALDHMHVAFPPGDLRREVGRHAADIGEDPYRV